MIVFLEDPGSLTMLTPLLNIFKKKKFHFHLVCSGFAVSLQKNFSLTIITDDNNSNYNARKIISLHLPEVVIVGTSENRNSFSLKLIEEAKKRKIKTIGVIDTPANASFRFRGQKNNPLFYATNYLWVVDNIAKNKFLELSYPKEKIFVFGHPYYWEIANKNKTLTKQKINQIRNKIYTKTKNNKIIVFLGEISDGLDKKIFIKNKDFNLIGTRNSVLRTEIILEELIKVIEKHKNLDLYVKPHPKEELNFYDKYRNSIKGIIRFKSPIDVCKGADLVVGITTNLLVEAYFASCEVISIIPNISQRTLINYSDELKIPYLSKRIDLENWIKNWNYKTIPQQKKKSYKLNYNPSLKMVDFIRKIVRTS